MRSNDLMWGTTAVNVFNFTFIQEYFAQILGLELGHYYHIVNNLHYYEPFQSKIENLAGTTTYSDDTFLYQKNFTSLEDFDEKLRLLEKYENGLREHTISAPMDFGDDFFNYWSKVFYQFHSRKPVQFLNPVLNHISGERKIFNSI
jgi:thymidylate synthase